MVRIYFFILATETWLVATHYKCTMEPVKNYIAVKPLKPRKRLKKKHFAEFKR